jgi:hypothetical protein
VNAHHVDISMVDLDGQYVATLPGRRKSGSEPGQVPVVGLIRGTEIGDSDSPASTINGDISDGEYPTLLGARAFRAMRRSPKMKGWKNEDRSAS